MSQFEFEAGVNDCLKNLEAPLSKGPMPRWQRKERERKLSSVGKPFSPIRRNSCSSKVSGMSSKSQLFTPSKNTKTPLKTPKKTPARSPKKFSSPPRGDRFIPNRPLGDCEWSHFQIVQGGTDADTNCELEVEANTEYQSIMSENMGTNPAGCKILHFKSGAPITKEGNGVE